MHHCHNQHCYRCTTYEQQELLLHTPAMCAGESLCSLRFAAKVSGCETGAKGGAKRHVMTGGGGDSSTADAGGHRAMPLATAPVSYLPGRVCLCSFAILQFRDQSRSSGTDPVNGCLCKLHVVTTASVGTPMQCYQCLDEGHATAMLSAQGPSV